MTPLPTLGGPNGSADQINNRGEVAGYAAAAILIVVGVAAVREALSADDDDAPRLDAGIGGRKLLLTGLSVSLDELAVGFSLGVLQVAVGPALAYIAVQAFALTFFGLAFGGRLGTHLGSRAELVSGVVLTLLGLALLVSEATGTHFL